MNETGNDLEAALRDWRQGDYAIGVGGHLFADVSDSPAEFYDAAEKTGSVVGLMVVSQTCDIVRPDGYVTVCALVERPAPEQKSIARGRKPSLLKLEAPPSERIVADLSRVMTVSKPLLASWNRREGFTTPSEQRRLALALERKFGRFAFPDELVEALQPFKERVWKKHHKESDPGRVYRSVRQFRLRSAPNWAAAEKEIVLFVLLHNEENRKTSLAVINKELDTIIGKTKLPGGYRWAMPEYEAVTADRLSAQDIFESQALDFEYLST